MRQKKIKLAETRLYFYPEVETRTVFVLTIGNKNEQHHDVNECHQFVRQRRDELKNEINKQEIQQRKGFIGRLPEIASTTTPRLRMVIQDTIDEPPNGLPASVKRPRAADPSR